MTHQLFADSPLVVLVANLVEQAVHEYAPEAEVNSTEYARMILDGLEMVGVPPRPRSSGLPAAPGFSAPALPERPAAPALRITWCAMCLQEKANRESAGLDPLTVHPAVTVIAGNAICNVAGRHQIVAQQVAALHQPGQLPPPFHRGGGPGRRAG